MFRRSIFSVRFWATLIPPSVWLVLPLISGIVWQAGFDSWNLGFVISLLCAECLSNLSSWNRWSAYSLLFLCFLFGSWRFASQEAFRATMRHQLARTPISFTGTVCARSPFGRAGAGGTIITIKIKEIEPDQKNPYPEQFLAYIRGERIQLTCYTETDLAYGDTVRVHNAFFPRYTQDDRFEQRLRKEAILSQARISQKQITKIESSNPPSLDMKFNKKLETIKSNFLQEAQRALSPGVFSLFGTIFLGCPSPQSNLSPRVRTLFEVWGISHMLARSGLHLVIIAMLIGAFLRCLPLAWYIQQFIIIMSIVLYALLSWPTISFMRALLMVIWYSLCGLCLVPVHPLHLISGVTFLILAYQPWYLFGLDFQLSFGLTAILAILRHSMLLRNIP